MLNRPDTAIRLGQSEDEKRSAINYINFVWRQWFNVGFTTPQQVEDLLGIPLLSSISRMEARDLNISGKVAAIPHYPALKPLSRFSESIRAIRSGLQMTDFDNPPKVVQVTSTVPGEGKTTIALLIAGSAAQSGLKVLFIDADLRRPSGSTFFKLKDESGLANLLLGQIGTKEAIRYIDDMKMWALPAGSTTKNLLDLLSSEKMKAFIASFKESFDLVVVDSPPVEPFVDPSIIAQLCDKCVFVVRWASTARELVKHSVQALAGHKKISGVVFNHVN